MLWSYLGAGRLAVLEKWLPYTVTNLDWFHCMLALMFTVSEYDEQVKYIIQSLQVSNIRCLC